MASALKRFCVVTAAPEARTTVERAYGAYDYEARSGVLVARAPKPALIHDGPFPSPRAAGIPIRAHPPQRLSYALRSQRTRRGTSSRARACGIFPRRVSRCPRGHDEPHDAGRLIGLRLTDSPTCRTVRIGGDGAYDELLHDRGCMGSSAHGADIAAEKRRHYVLRVIGAACFARHVPAAPHLRTGCATPAGLPYGMYCYFARARGHEAHMDLFRFFFCVLTLFTPALSFDDFARDSLSPYTRLGRQKHHTAPSVKFISVPLPSRTALVLFAHTSSSGTIVARSPQAAHTRLCAALYRTSKRDSASVAIYFLHCIITPNGAISKRLHFILLVPCSISAFQSDYMVMVTSAACVVPRSHR
ncbi:hypothetical protein C8J57DRAFT_1557842 [Mycena rebaudengoi]|nr:hypothetical protein C8J57DRAFT_1557842 [Mycena rebaudengoi]